jgi:hypothetical protein
MDAFELGTLAFELLKNLEGGKAVEERAHPVGQHAGQPFGMPLGSALLM